MLNAQSQKGSSSMQQTFFSLDFCSNSIPIVPTLLSCLGCQPSAIYSPACSSGSLIFCFYTCAHRPRYYVFYRTQARISRSTHGGRFQNHSFHSGIFDAPPWLFHALTCILVFQHLARLPFEAKPLNVHPRFVYFLGSKLILQSSLFRTICLGQLQHLLKSPIHASRPALYLPPSRQQLPLSKIWTQRYSVTRYQSCILARGAA